MLGAAHSARAGLIGYWPLSDGAGGQAIDKSGKGHNGAINGATWVTPGSDGRGACLQFNGSSARVEVPHANDLRFAATATYTLAAWVNWTTLPGHWSGVVTKGREVGNWYGIWVDAGNTWVFGHGGNNQNGSAIVPNVWTHVAMVYDNGTKSIYLNGRLDNRTVSSQNGDNTGDLWFGAAKGVTEFAPARIDDILIYDQALTDAEIQSIMKGLSDKSLAVNVSPEDGATDVPRDVTLNWTAGQYPATHDVYFGTTFADVNDATGTNTTGILASKGQADTTFDPPGSRAYGQTYYWRIDEVNTSADGTIYKGGVWSFTAEPYGYPITSITATASSSAASMGPEKTVDASGLTGDLHGTEGTTMWLSGGAQPNWIQYQFDKAYKLNDLKVWNSNQPIEGFLGFGAKNVTIETSADGTTWTALANVPEFARATGMAGYAANTTINMGGVMAKYVKLTITSNWGGMAPQTGLSEVRFSQIPVQARAPQPANAATGVVVETSLNWRPGREAGSHQVFFGTDPNAVANGAASAKTVADHAFAPGTLNLGTTYYWKVDEVNTATYLGNVWSFTTQEYGVVDDFESYNDDDQRIYDAWIDGYTDGKSGSLVGYLTATNGTFAETTVIHGGKQSMPFEYNNVKAPYYSEASRTFEATQNWTTNGADTLSLYFRGRAVGFADNGHGTFTMSSSGTDVWNNGDQFRFAYKSLNGDGSIVARVDSIVNTNVWAKGGVMIRQSIDTGSTHAFMPITAGGSGAGNGASFQRRLTAAGASTNDDKAAPAVAAPYWVKVERKGNSFTGSISADGKTWKQLGTAQTITMTNPVLIGLALCSHDAALTTTAEFSNVSTTGTVTGSWQDVAIGMVMPTNGPASLYLTVEDKAGKTKTVVNPNPSASATAAWTPWQIPLSNLTGLNLTAVQKITLGVGDKASPKAGGAGMLYIDDIGFGKPAAP
ncbi:MAG: discoidin domain-containing protein [Phycisphaerae bacterium]|nr:discoidin domain-containing protein [Phycisphaerae bacterium]